MGRTAVGIDIRSIGIDMQRDQIRTELAQCLYRCLVGSAFRTVNDDAQTTQVDRYAFPHKPDIFILQIKPVLDLADTGTGRQLYARHMIVNQLLDLILQLI